MNFSKFFIAFGACICWFAAYSQPPAGYYDPVENLIGSSLQQTLHDIIDNHTVISYNDLFGCFRKTDAKNDTIVWDMYSDRPGGTPAYLYFYGKGWECGNYDSEADCFNREHSFPKSWFGDKPPMNSDLFHIYPTDGYVNNKRANYPFGETQNPVWTSTNGSSVGPSSWPGFSGTIFEPVDDYKGDFARTFFYMATRYFGEDASWPGSDMVDGAEIKSWAREMLLDWHRKDSVSIKETTRNNAVSLFQKNRNPFIDHPEFAGKIWGNLSQMVAVQKMEPELIIYPNPVSDVLNLKVINGYPGESVVQIYGISGNLTFQTRLGNLNAGIETAQLLPGVYIIRIIDERGTLTGTFIRTGARNK